VCATAVADWTKGDLVVVRALPAAAGATSRDLAGDLSAAAQRVGLAGRSLEMVPS
jgi:hypothetical protein